MAAARFVNDKQAMAQAAALFRSLGDKWRDPDTAAAIVERFVGANRFVDVTGYAGTSGKHAYCPLSSDFRVNNQMVYPSASIRFGSGELIGYRPWCV